MHTVSSNQQLSRRAFVAALGSLLFINACKTKALSVSLHVVLFSYLDRPIFDVEIDGGVGETSAAYPNTGKGVTAGLGLTLGVKKVTWRLDGPEGAPRNGETVVNKNHLELNELVPGAEYLGLHIYPDDTVEFTTSVRRPDFTERGMSLAAKAAAIRG